MKVPKPMPDTQICVCCGQPIVATPSAKYGLITDRVASAYGVTTQELLSHQRARILVQARNHLYFLLREQGLSYPQIGRMLGGRDHSTVIHGVRRFKQEAKRLEDGLGVPEVKRVGSGHH